MASSLSKEPLKITRVNVIKFKCVNFKKKIYFRNLHVSAGAVCDVTRALRVADEIFTSQIHTRQVLI